MMCCFQNDINKHQMILLVAIAGMNKQPNLQPLRTEMEIKQQDISIKMHALNSQLAFVYSVHSHKHHNELITEEDLYDFRYYKELQTETCTNVSKLCSLVYELSVKFYKLDDDDQNKYHLKVILF